MNKYSIFCTESQTKRAYKLGAPIETIEYNSDYIRLYPQVSDVESMRKSHLDIIERNDKGIVAGHTPTAEQMVGFIIEKNPTLVSQLAYSIKTFGYKQGCLIFINEWLK